MKQIAALIVLLALTGCQPEKTVKPSPTKVLGGNFLSMRAEDGELIGSGEYATKEGCAAAEENVRTNYKGSYALSFACETGKGRDALPWVTDVTDMKGPYAIKNYRLATQEFCEQFSTALGQSPGIRAAGGFVLFRCHKR